MGALKGDRLARYSELIAEPDFLDAVCQRMGEGESLSDICRSLDVGYSKVMFWLMADVGRYGVFEKALSAQARFEVDEALEIADTPQLGEKRKVNADGSEEVTHEDMLGHRKLRVEARFRRAKAHAPELYGDKLKVEKSVTVEADAGLLVAMGDLLRLAGGAAVQPRLVGSSYADAEPWPEGEAGRGRAADEDDGA